MMLATEPRSVRLPANVVASAIAFHISSGLAKPGNPFPSHEYEGDVGENRSGSREPSEIPGLRRRRRAKEPAETGVNLVRQACTVQSFDDNKERREKEQQVPVH